MAFPRQRLIAGGIFYGCGSIPGSIAFYLGLDHSFPVLIYTHSVPIDFYQVPSHCYGALVYPQADPKQAATGPGRWHPVLNECYRVTSIPQPSRLSQRALLGGKPMTAGLGLVFARGTMEQHVKAGDQKERQ
mgnify:CR=1 FL=1